MATKIDARQVIDRDLLNRITGASGSQTDTVFAALNSEITPPLAFSVTGANRVVTIGNITVTNPSTNLNRTVPPISQLLPAFSSGTVTFDPTGAGNATPSAGSALALGMTASKFMRVGVSIDPLGSLTLTKGTEAASLAAATTPAVPSGLFGIGQIVVRTDGSNNVANVLTSDLYQYVGGGGGSGSGDASSILETIKNELVDSSYQNVTPSIASQQAATLVSSFGGTGSYSIADQTYLFPVIADSLTSVQMLDEEEFISNNPTDITKSLAYLAWRSGYIDPSSTVEISRNGGTNYYPVTMSRVGANTEAFTGEYEWTREEEVTDLSDSSTVDETQTELSNLAGTTEAAADIFQLPNADEGVQLRIKNISVRLSRLGTLVGNYRFALYSNDPSLSNSPSVRLFTGAWQAASAVSTSAVDISLNTDLSNLYIEDNSTLYHIVIETDDTYKAGFSAGVNALRVHRSNGTTATGIRTLDGSTWTAISASRVYRSITYTHRRFTSLIADTAGSGFNQTLNASNQQAIALKFTVASGIAYTATRVTIPVFKSGTPSGTYWLKIVKDNAGVPSTAAADIMGVSVSKNAIDAAGTDVKIAFGNSVIGPGTYHIVFETDATYKANIGSGNISWGGYTGSAVTTAGAFDGSTWSSVFFADTTHLKHIIEGRPLDLRLRITSGTTSVQLAAFAAFYEIGTPIAHGTKNFDKKLFKSQTDNLSSFAINFVPDPDLLRVYRIGTGQVFKYPDFTFSGSTITFPVNTFYDSSDKDVELHFVQTEGSSFDSSDKNALLLASNYLGSADSSLDRSQAGRGIFLRRPDGTLREITIDNNDLIAVYSV
jgi:hypothetical protein